MLFAEAAATVDAGYFPSYFGTMLLAVVLVFGLGQVLNLLGFRVIDWITPGNLGQELLGTADKGPNLALGLVVAAMFLGMSIVLGCTIIAVLVH